MVMLFEPLMDDDGSGVCVMLSLDVQFYPWCFLLDL